MINCRRRLSDKPLSFIQSVFAHTRVKKYTRNFDVKECNTERTSQTKTETPESKVRLNNLLSCFQAMKFVSHWQRH